MFIRNHKPTQNIQVSVNGPLYARAKAFLVEVRKNPLSFKWDMWKKLVDENGGLKIVKKGSDILFKDKSSEYLLKALLVHISQYAITYNALPAGFLSLPEKAHIIDWMNGLPDFSDDTKELIKSLDI